MQELTQQGINALKAGDRAEAQKLLRQAIEGDPEDTIAWLWLSGAVEEDEQRILCLNQVLKIDPNNQAAVRGLEKLQSKVIAPPAPQKPTEPAIAEESKFEAPSLPETVQQEPVESQPQAIPPIPSPIKPQAFPVRKPTESVSQAPAQRIFRVRPSQVPALASFWLFFIGTILLGILLSGQPQPVLYFVVGTGIILEFVVLFAILRNFRSQYELTDQYLSLPFRGKKNNIPLPDLLHVDIRRSFWQEIRGTADILIDGIVQGELAHLRLRDLAGYEKLVDQIKAQAINQE